MAGSSNPSQELLSLLLGGGGGGPAIPNGGPPPIQPKPASNSTAAALPAATPGQDPLEALFQAMKVKEQAPSPLSPHQQSQPPMPAPRPDARQASFLAAFNSPHMPTKPILNGSPSKGSEPALEVSDGGRQLLAMLNAMGGGGSRETSSKAPAPQSEEQVLPPVTMPESEGLEPGPEATLPTTDVASEAGSAAPSTQASKSPAAISSAPTPTSKPKPSPFAFISPFDIIEQQISQSRSASTASPSVSIRQEQPRSASAASTALSVSNLPPLPTSPGEDAVSQDKAQNAASLDALFSSLTAPSQVPADSIVSESQAGESERKDTESPTEETVSGTAPMAISIAQEEVEERASTPKAVEPTADAIEATLPQSAQPSSAGASSSESVSTHSSNQQKTVSINLDGSFPSMEAYVSTQPISRFKSASTFSKGRQIAVNGLISYSTRGGRTRVIDPRTGARLIQKIHGGAAVDMAISETFKSSSPYNDPQGHLRYLASIGKDRLVVWAVPASFDTDDVVAEVLLELGGEYTYLAFSPTEPRHLAVATKSQDKVYVLDIGKIHGEYLSYDDAQDKLQDVPFVELPDGAAAISFSSDGSTLLTLSKDNILSFSTVPSCDVITATLLTPTSVYAPTEALLLNSSTSGRPAALAVARAEGQVVEIFVLPNLTTPAVVLKAGGGSSNFGHLRWIAERQTLVTASSERKCVYLVTLDLSWSPMVADPKDSDEEALRSIFSSRDVPSYSDSIVKRIVSIPAEHSILQTVSATLEQRESLFYLHPEGFDQIILDEEVFASEASLAQGDEAAIEGRLEGEDGTRSALESESAPDAAPIPDIRIQQSVRLAPLTAEQVESLPSHDKDASRSSFAHSADDAVSTSATAGGEIAGDSAQPSGDIPSFSPDTSLPSGATEALQSLSDAATALGASAANLDEEGSQADAAKLLQKMQGLFLEQASLFENMLVNQQRAEKNRYEQIIKFISDTLTLNTQNMIEQVLEQHVSSAINTAVAAKIVPEIQRAFAGANASLQEAVLLETQALKQTAASQVESAVSRQLKTQLHAEITQLGQSLPAILGPHIDFAVQDRVVPTVERLDRRVETASSEQVETLREMRQTIASELITREENITALEEEVRSLRAELDSKLEDKAQSDRQIMDSMRQEMAEMKTLLLSRSQQRIEGMISRAPSVVANGMSPGHSATLPAPTQPAVQSSPAAVSAQPEIVPVLPETPLQDYEDLFLQALQGPRPLTKLIDDAPPSRLQRVFPRDGTSPAISPQAILALSFFLAKDIIASSAQELSYGERVRLAWIVSCVTALEKVKTDARYKAYIPRLMTDTLHSLNERRKALSSLQDIEAIQGILQMVDAVALNQ